MASINHQWTGWRGRQRTDGVGAKEKKSGGPQEVAERVFLAVLAGRGHESRSEADAIASVEAD